MNLLISLMQALALSLAGAVALAEPAQERERSPLPPRAEQGPASDDRLPPGLSGQTGRDRLPSKPPTPHEGEPQHGDTTDMEHRRRPAADRRRDTD